MADSAARQAKVSQTSDVGAAPQTKKSQTSEVEKDSSIRLLILGGILKALPTICILGFAVWFAVKFGAVIETKLLPNIQGFKAFGLELTFAANNLQKVPVATLDGYADGRQDPYYAKNAEKLMDDAPREQIIRRTLFIAPLLRNSRILWVDDHPENNIYQRDFLQSIGISVDCAQDNRTAYLLLEGQRRTERPYDLILSDYHRDHEPGETGFTLLKGMTERDYQLPVIYFTASGQPKPPGAFQLTDRSNDLLNFIFDALERANTAKKAF